MKVYLIPGLGYDTRFFSKLDLGDLAVEKIEWIEPAKPDENILDYSKRLFSRITSPEESILIGHSFGGIVSLEIASVKKVKKVILISSIKSTKEMPFGFVLINKLSLHKLFTRELSVKTIRFWGKKHGFTNEDSLDLFKSMVGKQSNDYLQWALKALSSWKPSKVLPGVNIHSVHGTDDRTFPIHLIENPDVVVEKGSHIMVYNKPKVLSEILLNLIEK